MMKSKVLHTIGYEGILIEDFLNILNNFGIDLLIDVREVPISRKRGFSKTRLAEALQSRNVDYLHLKGLGDPKPGRVAAREGRFSDFRRIFSAHLQSTVAEIDLRRGVDAASERFACLMCFERNHQNCHRCIVADEMAQRGGFQLIHLGAQSHAELGHHAGSLRKPHAASRHVG